MSTSRIASVAFLVLVFGAGPTTQADPPIGSGPFADGKVIQAAGSGTVASRVLQRTSFEPQKGQVKFGIEILSVDAETRDKIYQTLGAKNVKTRISTVSTQTASSGSEETNAPAESDLISRHTITTGSIVSTAVLSGDQADELYAIAKESSDSKSVSRPTLIAGDGQPASFQQQVQRPFLSQLQRVEQGDNAGVQSDIQVLNEGTELTVMARAEGNALNIDATIQYSHVAGVDQFRVYGLSEDQSVIQVPSHEVRIASASQQLLPKQTLLLDPYFQSRQVKASTVSTPLLDQLPYVGSAFSTTETEEVTMYTLVLLKAKKL